ncbi:MAG: NAD-dependent epimerase/dehydratase family protein [Novosphingobium sp.]|nr:NAD-dependent epimerase/dehydratase family protein [Novosphingobium sp.]
MPAGSPSKKVLIAGASGAVGSAALTHFAGLPDLDVVGLSRRPPIVPLGKARHMAVDLLDREECARVSGAMKDVTHVVFAALNEREDDVVAGWSDPAQMAKNANMLANLCDPLFDSAPGLRHISLVHGPKAYGVHLPDIDLPIPLRETQPRAPGDNFYYWQEDYLAGKKLTGAGQADWTVTILRPYTVVGTAIGGALSPFLVLAVFASLRREAGLDMPLPAGRGEIVQFTDADLIAEALAWAAETPEARDEVFNLTNGDVFATHDAFALAAEALGVPIGPVRPYDIAEELAEVAYLWPGVVAKYGLSAPADLDAMLGYSPQVARSWSATVAPGDELRWNLGSTIKVRQAGFGACIDTADMMRKYLRRYQDLRLIPPAP